MHINLLKIGKGSNNAKLAKLEAKLGAKVYTYSLPAGYTCPGASLCQSRFDRKLGRIVDGERQEFRCFAASMEAVFTGFRENNDHNFALLKGKTEDQMVDLITDSVRAQVKPGSIMRVHVSGDYFSETYFRAWMRAARELTDIRFYSYTKSINFLVKNMDMVPPNFSITCSQGGKFDKLIARHEYLKSARVVFSIEAATLLGLQIDHDDSHAATGTDSFALLLHGQQPKGSRAALALKKHNR